MHVVVEGAAKLLQGKQQLPSHMTISAKMESYKPAVEGSITSFYSFEIFHALPWSYKIRICPKSRLIAVQILNTF